ncbi:MAG: transposase [Nitrospira sp.]|nr:transposase [Nitrospira sp.]MCC7470092.1 transposase [Candidatus Nomurabacteria bacterium]
MPQKGTPSSRSGGSLCIQPGKPDQNAFIERFKGRFEDRVVLP